MKHIEFINLGGTKYPLVWSLRVASLIEEEHGNIKSAMDAMKSGTGIIRVIATFLYGMADAGAGYANYIKYQPPSNGKFAYHNGKWQAPSKTDIEYMLDFDEEGLNEIMTSITKCMEKSKGQELKTKPVQTSKKKSSRSSCRRNTASCT